MDYAGHPTALVFNLESGSPFSFKCQVCSVCCTNKAIRIGPYEALRLARSLGTTTTGLLKKYTEDGSPVLRNKPDGSCIFLGTRGCGVHPDRPLVCRLFPLGQLVDEQGSARFAVMPLHPDCLGMVDTDGTVESYLESQGARPYFRCDGLYSALYKKIIRKRPGLLTLWSDVDAGLALFGRGERSTGSENLDRLVNLHLQALEEWVGGL